MVEDFDHLDKESFGDTFKKYSLTLSEFKTNSGPISARMDTDVKKRVLFKDLSGDDPLYNLLSEIESSPKKRKDPNVKDFQKFGKIVIEEDNGLTNSQDKSNLEDSTKKSLLMQELFENASVPKEEWQTTTSQQSLVFNKGENTGYAVNAKEPRRSRRNSKIINDPLGLLHTELLSESFFQSDSEILKSQTTDMKNTGVKLEQNDLPEWLGGGKKSEGNKTEIQEKTGEKIPNRSDAMSKTRTGQDDTRSIDLVLPPSNTEAKQYYPNDFSLLIGTHLEQQATIMAMQQQEHKMSTATVLSEQNEQLNKLIEIQRARLAEQEKQFNAIIKIQSERQSMLEKQLRVQQERIDEYIRPASRLLNASSNINMEESTTNTNSRDETEKLLRNSQLEKSELDSMLSAINEKHKLELLIQEESYKRQINLFQEITEMLGKKTKKELEMLETNYIEKLEKWRVERMQLESNYKEEIGTYKKKHAEEIEEIHEGHIRNIQLLQKDHLDSIKSISAIKQAEDQLIETVTNRSTDIDDILQKTSLLINNIKDMHGELRKQNDEVVKIQENHLKMREDEIKNQQEQLDKQRNTLDFERVKIVEIVEKLDSRVMQLIDELQKQIASNNAAEQMFEKMIRNILHERELLEERTNWERDHLQALRDCWLKERGRQLKTLTEEKEMVAAERAQLELFTKLKTDTESMAKMESEVTIKAALDAIARANQEKMRWQELTNELEVQKQHLEKKERMLVLRAKELANLTQTALAKKEKSVKALKEAKQLEGQRKQEFDQLQVQLAGLIQREKIIASQKLNLARRERMLSQASDIEQPVKDTKIDDTTNLLKKLLPYNQNTRHVEIIDPQLTILKLHLNDQLNPMERDLDIIDG